MHHQVDVLQKNNFNKATDAMFSNGIEPGGHRHIDNNDDGKGGPGMLHQNLGGFNGQGGLGDIFGSMGSGISSALGSARSAIGGAIN